MSTYSSVVELVVVRVGDGGRVRSGCACDIVSGGATGDRGWTYSVRCS